jgi:hypothetical protein
VDTIGISTSFGWIRNHRQETWGNRVAAQISFEDLHLRMGDWVESTRK